MAPLNRIGDHGIIGDCRSAALVGRDGEIDWLCWPQFDSPAIFASLLDPARGGKWKISAKNCKSVQRSYVPDSNVLRTIFHCSGGTAILTDLMPVASEEFKRGTFLPDHEIIRVLECAAGEIQGEIEFQPRANYGESPVTLRDRGKLGIQTVVGRGAYWLRADVPLTLQTEGAQSVVNLRAGEKVRYSLSYSENAPCTLPPLQKWVDECIPRSVAWWQDWAKRAQYDGPYRDSVVRSALTLKLLTYAPSGAIIASPTTSLPERVGGSLNWDYRFCWLRDASLTIRALMELGFREEADDFMNWLLHATRLTQPELRIMYDVFGEIAPHERELKHLSGYCDSRPVRIGNGAREQLQLDVYGEVIDAAAQYAFHGGELDHVMQSALVEFGKHVVTHWNQPDEGIWEPRNKRQEHTHSRLLCWTALDRLITLAKDGSIKDGPLDLFKNNREMIRHQLEKRAWNDRLQSYVSCLDGDELDGSLLLLSWYGFEKADSPRMRKTYCKLRESLGAGDTLIYRYRTEPAEGAFAICSFWEAEYLAMGGASLEDSHRLFRALLNYKNEVGLYGEEIDPHTGAALGNFPQAFTHVGLIGAALSIQQRETGEQQLPHRAEQASSQPPEVSR